MMPDRSSNVAIHLGILHRTEDGSSVGGQNYIDEDGRLAVRLYLNDSAGERHVHLHKGEEFDLSGNRWQVLDVAEPKGASRGLAATVRVLAEDDGSSV